MFDLMFRFSNFIASTAGPIDKSKITNGFSPPRVQPNLSKVIGTMFVWAGIICVLMIIIAGIMYITSVGNPSKAQTAKNALVYSILGLILIVFSGAIVQIIIGGVSGGGNLQANAQTLITALLWFVGVSSVIVIVFSGLMMIFSIGNPASFQKAKSAILYAVFGVIISLSAGFIINFVLSRAQ